ncbi:hypothetical protein O6H91_10G016300 [Diphasiastrum complanatum]|nr:hypothetical protein O6H91_10G016300 [Diphasiastrum complanatum]
MAKGRGWLAKLGLRGNSSSQLNMMDSSIPQGPDADVPEFHQQFAQFGAGRFWGVELAYQRVPGVTKTEVGYSQGHLHNPTYRDVCEGDTGHCEVVRVVYDPKVCTYESLLEVFWACHDPTALEHKGRYIRPQCRSAIYYYTAEQEKIAKESLENHQNTLDSKILTEILPFKKFYRAEIFHQQYLSRGGRFGFRQSAAKGCKDPIRPYG